MPIEFFSDVQFEQVMSQGENHGDHNPPVIRVSVGKVTYAIAELDPNDCLTAYGLVDDGKGHIELKNFDLLDVCKEVSKTKQEAKVSANMPPSPLYVFKELSQAMMQFTDNKDMLEAAERDIAERKGYTYTIKRSP